MSEIETFVNDSKLPSQLKEYFTASESIQALITKKILSEIEDLYIYYISLYKFDTSEFSAFTITSLKKCKDLDSFYYYLKKVIDTNLELKSKDKSFNCGRDYLFLNDDFVDILFKETVVEFCDFIDSIYKKNENLNLKKTYISLGKLELINRLISNTDYNKILISGKRVLEQHESNKD
ncbi:hypothetical protein [Sporosarcina limicola]|uniref:Uncharacterized protein n=1 Tax=Sporosarcina limicola TaxID=34101 RepID=A0A927R4K0_9BACL|nr:hypothetical protein [Sporosarcina limicola]MBE1556291.1 hypothetical protein [Sporosarcina limicola]